MLARDQGPGASGLRVRGRRRVAGAADPPRAASTTPAPFAVDAYHVSMRSDGDASVCEATVKVRVGSERAHTVAEGDGPVNALDAALRAALVTLLPATAERPPDRLQSPHHRLDHRHRGDAPAC